MKNLFRSLIFTAVVCMFASCQMEELRPEQSTNIITVNAAIEEGLTKTNIDDKYIYWDENETMSLVAFNTDGSNAYISPSTSFTADENDNTVGTFTFSISELEGEKMLSGVYPTSAAISGDNALRYRVELKGIQNATAKSYDPEAFLMITKAQQFTFPAENTVLDAEYKRIIALNKFTLNNFNDSITSVKITFPGENYIRGRKYVDLSTGTPEATTYYNQGFTDLTIYYETAIPAEAAAKDIWFTSWGVEVAAGATIKVEIISEDEEEIRTYTKEITNADGALAFKENWLNQLTLDMTGATPKTEAKVNYNGEYLIVAQKDSESPWHLMSNYSSQFNNYSGLATEVSTELASLSASAFHDIYVTNSIWVVESDENGYLLKNKASGKYLSLATDDFNKNQAYESEEKVNISIEVAKNSAYLIKNEKTATRSLQFYYDKTSPRFTGYKTGQDSIYFIKWTEPAGAKIVVETSAKTVTADTNSVTFNYHAYNISSGISAAEGTDTDNIISAVSAANGVVTVTLTPNTEEKEKTATVVLSGSGVENITLTITQEAKAPDYVYNWVLQKDELGSSSTGEAITSATKGTPDLIWTLSEAPAYNWNTDKGVQLGTSKKPLSLDTPYTLETTATGLTVSKVIVNASNANNGGATITVFINDVAISETAATTATDYTFNLTSASSSPKIKIAIQNNTNSKAVYLKSIIFM